MARRCAISGKGAQNGHNVSHSNNKTNKVTYPNLKTKRLFNSETGKWITIKVSARTLRTIDKKGLAATLRSAKL